MKNLIVYTHLNPKSFTKAVSDKIEQVLSSRQQEVKVIDLYSENYNPILQYPDIAFGFLGEEAPLDTAKYQALIEWADQLIFVFPLWWYQMPAVLKGFIDRTFTNGFAFEMKGEDSIGLLKNKKAHLFINAGGSEEEMQKSGLDIHLKRILSAGLFEFCGIQPEITIFPSVPTVSQEVREQYLKNIASILQ